MKKILVTGGNGYIGSRLCLYLAEKGYQVTPVCYPKIPENKEWIAKMKRVVIGDVRDQIFLYKLADEVYDVVIHLVSLDHRQSEGDPAYVTSVNIIPIWNLLNIFSKRGLKKFIYFSTVQVYGRLPNEDITEQCESQVLNTYALTHRVGEEICDFYNRTTSVDCRVVRLSNSYGAPIFVENNCWWLVINDLCRQSYYEKKIALQSDGTPLRDFIHGWDVCQAVEKIMNTDHSNFLYHISSGKTLTIYEIAQSIQEVFYKRYGQEIPITRIGDVSVSVDQRYYINNTLLQTIGFRPLWSIERGIDDLFNFLEQNDGK